MAIAETGIVKLKSRNTIRSGGADQVYSFTEESTFMLTGEAQIPDFLMSGYVPTEGASHPKWPMFTSRTARVSSNSANIGGGYTVTLSVEWAMTPIGAIDGKDQDGNTINVDTPPWKLPVEDYRIGTQFIEESVKNIWVPNKDESGNIIDGYHEAPFVNTAGTPLVATATRNLMTVSFSYNVPWTEDGETELFPDSLAKDFVGCVNDREITVCGVTYPPITLRIETIDPQLMRVMDEVIVGSDGENTIVSQVEKFRYKKIGVNMIADPKTFFRDYENIGMEFVRMHQIDESKLVRTIWTANELESEGNHVFYDALNILKNGHAYLDGRRYNVDVTTIERVSEPMYLDEHGAIIQPDPETGKQTPYRLRGCPDRPADFSRLRFPRRK